MKVLRAFALRFPEAEEGIACAGTALEKRTIKAGGKAFLFLSQRDVMLKLGESIPEATTLASKQPDRCKVGAHGWVTILLSPGDPPPLDVLKRWIEKSYRLLAPKPLVAMLSDRNSRRTSKPQSGKRALVKKTPRRNRRGPVPRLKPM